MQLQNAVNQVFLQLSDSLQRLSQEQYIKSCDHLFGASIGQHVRHIIEMYQCLQAGYSDGTIYYEKRNRDVNIETDKLLADTLLKEIHATLSNPDKELLLVVNYDDTSLEPLQLKTNFHREIAYNLEHTIHHMALIRVGMQEVSDIQLPEEYGVASSTVKHRKSCAQ
jgi:hypothetical protein